YNICNKMCILVIRLTKNIILVKIIKEQIIKNIKNCYQRQFSIQSTNRQKLKQQLIKTLQNIVNFTKIYLSHALMILQILIENYFLKNMKIKIINQKQKQYFIYQIIYQFNQLIIYLLFYLFNFILYLLFLYIIIFFLFKIYQQKLIIIQFYIYNIQFNIYLFQLYLQNKIFTQKIKYINFFIQDILNKNKNVISQCMFFLQNRKRLSKLLFQSLQKLCTNFQKSICMYTLYEIIQIVKLLMSYLLQRIALKSR
ncbi:hypothetical protein IMG5_167260, partial [Ichthyophthirius multifiliis]